MGNLLSYKFWLNARPGVLAATPQKIFLAFVVGLIIFTAIFAYAKSRYSRTLYGRFWDSLYYFSLSNAIIGLFLLFFSYEMVPFLSSRFWFLLWAAIMLVWIFFIGKGVFAIPRRKAQLEKEKEFKKYIPGS